MSNQVQCPNCGGYKIDGNVRRIDPETGKAISIDMSSVWILLVGFILTIQIAFTEGSGFALGVLVITIVVSSIVANITKRKVKQAEARAYNLYSYSCNLCGYRWDWREGQPRPKVKVNPDLIDKGAQKLEEEDKQRRKQQEDAAALYHLTHKK